jgi:hypothetical protein
MQPWLANLVGAGPYVLHQPLLLLVDERCLNSAAGVAAATSATMRLHNSLLTESHQLPLKQDAAAVGQHDVLTVPQCMVCTQVKRVQMLLCSSWLCSRVCWCQCQPDACRHIPCLA